jgi:hypothetical protein
MWSVNNAIFWGQWIINDNCESVTWDQASNSLLTLFKPWIQDVEKLELFLRMYKTKATDERHCLVDLFHFMWFGISTKS